MNRGAPWLHFGRTVVVACVFLPACLVQGEAERESEVPQLLPLGDRASENQSMGGQPSGGVETGEACACERGFGPDDEGLCSDVDECEAGSHTCDAKRGICSNTEGGFACSCAEGSFGDGLFCKLDSACAEPRCENGGHCVETLSDEGFACICPLGTTGELCEDATTCALNSVLDDESAPLVSDAALRRRLREVTSRTGAEPLYVADLAGLYSLALRPAEGAEDEVLSLAGLECWPSLNELHLGGHPVASLEPIANLNFLLSLELSCGTADSLEPLSDHVLLEELVMNHAGDCQRPFPLEELEEVSPLVGLRKLSLLGARPLDLKFLLPLRQLEVLELSSWSELEKPSSETHPLLSACGE